MDFNLIFMLSIKTLNIIINNNNNWISGQNNFVKNGILYKKISLLISIFILSFNQDLILKLQNFETSK